MILQAKLSMAQSTAEELNDELFRHKSVFQLDGVKRENKTDQLSETSNGQEILGAKEERAWDKCRGRGGREGHGRAWKTEEDES